MHDGLSFCNRAFEENVVSSVFFFERDSWKRFSPDELGFLLGEVKFGIFNYRYLGMYRISMILRIIWLNCLLFLRKRIF